MIEENKDTVVTSASCIGIHKSDVGEFAIKNPYTDPRSLIISNCDRIRLESKGLDFISEINNEIINQFEYIIINGIKFKREK